MVNINDKCENLWNRRSRFRISLIAIILLWSLGYMILIVLPLPWKNINVIAYEDTYLDSNDPYVVHNNETLICDENRTIYLKFVFDTTQTIRDIEFNIDKDNFYYEIVQNGWEESTLTYADIPDVIGNLSIEEGETTFNLIDFYSIESKTISIKITCLNTNEIFEFPSKETINNNLLSLPEDCFYVTVSYTGLTYADILPFVLYSIIMIGIILIIFRTYKKYNVGYEYYCVIKTDL